MPTASGESSKVYYDSKELSHAKKCYTLAEQLLLGMVFAFEKFQSYLLGIKVIMNIDH